MKTRKSGKKYITQVITNRIYVKGKPLFYKDAKGNNTDNPVLPRMVGKNFAKDDANHKIGKTIRRWNRKGNILNNELTLGKNIALAPTTE